jgi:hypothetical protein
MLAAPVWEYHVNDYCAYVTLSAGYVQVRGICMLLSLQWVTVYIIKAKYALINGVS